MKEDYLGEVEIEMKEYPIITLKEKLDIKWTFDGETWIIEKNKE
jgi:hypothetical protein